MTSTDQEQRWAALMRAAMAGDSRAYREVLSEIAPHLRAMARRRCNQYGIPLAEAEDVVQEVLLTVHLKRGSWDPHRPLGPWLSTVVRHKLIDFLRHKGRETSIAIEDVAETLGIGEEPDPSRRLDVETILGRLKDPHLTIVRSISIEGASVRETADRLNMSEGAVRIALHRSLKRLSATFRLNHEVE